MIAIWGGGSAGNRYKKIVEDIGLDVILLKRNKDGKQFDFNDLDIDYVKAAIICTPTIYHSNQSINFLSNKIPVLCEKPIAHTYIDGKRILDCALDNNTKFHPGYNQRQLSALKYFKDDRWGKPLFSQSVWAERVSNWQPGKDYKESYSVRKDLGGGVPLTLSHDFDWWTGIYDDLTVTNVESKNYGSLGLDIDTHFTVTLEGSVKCIVDLNYENEGEPERYYETTYEKGILRYSPLNGTLDFFWNDGNTESLISSDWQEDRINSFKDTFQFFISDDRPPSSLSAWELGLSALKIANIVDSWNEK